MDKVTHFELPADNIAKAQEFYKKCFGWSVAPVPAMEYDVLTTGPTDEQRMPQESGFINGGLFKRTDQLRNPVIVISVSKIDDIITKIKDAGGKIVQEPRKVGDMGIVAYFRDTEGNIMGLWQSQNPQ